MLTASPASAAIKLALSAMLRMLPPVMLICPSFSKSKPAVGVSAGKMRRQIWLRFATWILLGLEFALAADILRTAVAPTWDDISKLAVIATIRTMLNYFLAKDIMAFDKSQEENPQAGAIKAEIGQIPPVNQLDGGANMWFSP